MKPLIETTPLPSEYLGEEPSKAIEKLREQIQARKKEALLPDKKQKKVDSLIENANKFLSHGNIESAFINLARALKLDPNSAQVNYYFAKAYETAGEISFKEKRVLEGHNFYKQAVLKTIRATEITPNNAEYHFYLGLLHSKYSKDSKKAYSKMFKAILLEPENIHFRTQAIMTLRQDERHEDARLLIQQTLALDPNNQFLLFLRKHSSKENNADSGTNVSSSI